MHISGKDKKVAHKAGQFIPKAVRASAIDLERLLQAYYEWAEASGGFAIESKKLLDNFSYRTADDAFLMQFKNTMLRMFPDISNELLKHLLKFSRVFYQQRGTPESYKFLFRALWGDESLELTYPSNYILKSSDGVWKIKDMIKLDVSSVQQSFPIESTLLVGANSKARAYVSELIEFDEDALTVLVTLDNISADFEIGEDIKVYSDVNAERYITTLRAVPVIGSYEIVNPGAGYIPNREIEVLDNAISGNGLKVKISGVEAFTGQIRKLDIISTGHGYSEVPQLNMTDLYLYGVEYSKRTPAVIKLKFTANYKAPGEYIKKKSLLSDLWKLRDGKYYQEYSYVINTNVDKSKVMGPVKDLVHPAGMAVFYNKKYDKSETRYIDLSASNFSGYSEFTTKSDGLIRYSNFINYSTPGTIYV